MMALSPHLVASHKLPLEAENDMTLKRVYSHNYTMLSNLISNVMLCDHSLPCLLHCVSHATFDPSSHSVIIRT